MKRTASILFVFCAVTYGLAQETFTVPANSELQITATQSPSVESPAVLDLIARVEELEGEIAMLKAKIVALEAFDNKVRSAPATKATATTLGEFLK